MRTRGQPHPSLRWTLDAITAGPAFVRNGRLDLLAANPLGRAFCTAAYASGGQSPNLARFTFLEPAARRFYPEWVHHPVVGDRTLACQSLEMTAEPGHILTIYTAEPGSPDDVP